MIICMLKGLHNLCLTLHLMYFVAIYTFLEGLFRRKGLNDNDNIWGGGVGGLKVNEVVLNKFLKKDYECFINCHTSSVPAKRRQDEY